MYGPLKPVGTLGFVAVNPTLRVRGGCFAAVTVNLRVAVLLGPTASWLQSLTLTKIRFSGELGEMEPVVADN